MRWLGLRASIVGPAYATAMIYMVLLGADLLNAGLAITQLPSELANWVKGSDGFAGDDPAHDPDLLSGGHGPRA